MSFWVFKADGTLQCGMGKEIPADEMRKELAAIVGDAQIVKGEKRHLPVMVSQRCGAPTANVNAYELTPEGAFVFNHGFVGTMGFSIWVWRDPKAARESADVKPAAEGMPLPWPFPWLKKSLEESDESGANAFMNLIASVNEAGNQPTTIAELKGHHCRFYKSGDMLTMDFNSTRVNIEHDENSVIKRVWFG